MDRFDEFDPRRPLGAGTTVLEASARLRFGARERPDAPTV